MGDGAGRLHLGCAEDAAVVVLAAAGDDEAFGELVRRCQGRVRNFLRRLCGQPDVADDLAQQAFLRAWKSMRRLRAPDAFWGWMRRIMISVWMDELRRRKLVPRSLESLEPWESRESREPRDGPQQASGAPPGMRMDLDAALGMLPLPMRLCVALAYGDGMSHAEIAEATGIPLGTVKSYISRGAAKLRELLADYRPAAQGR